MFLLKKKKKKHNTLSKDPGISAGHIDKRVKMQNAEKKEIKDKHLLEWLHKGLMCISFIMINLFKFSIMKIFGFTNRILRYLTLICYCEAHSINSKGLHSIRKRTYMLEPFGAEFEINSATG